MVEVVTPGEKINAEPRIWKGLGEKLGRLRTVDVASWSLERGNCMTPSLLGSSW